MGLLKQSKMAWLWRYQGARAEREKDLPQGTPWSESAWTAIHVLMDKRGNVLANSNANFY